MPIIIISSDAETSEQQIAEQTAKTLGYQTLGPDLLPAVAEKYGAPADKLAEVLGRIPPPWWRRQTKRGRQYLSWIEAEVLDRLMADGIVCWGLAAHLYVLGVSHVLKARLLTDNVRQAEQLSEQYGIQLRKAQKRLENAQRRRTEWSVTTFNQDELDPSLYDLVINLGQIEPDEAVSNICGAAGYRRFQPMTYSINALADIALAAKVKVKLLESLSDIRVQTRDGQVVVTSKAMKHERNKKATAIKALAAEVPGVNFVEVHLINYVIREAAQSSR